MALRTMAGTRSCPPRGTFYTQLDFSTTDTDCLAARLMSAFVGTPVPPSPKPSVPRLLPLSTLSTRNGSSGFTASTTSPSPTSRSRLSAGPSGTRPFYRAQPAALTSTPTRMQRVFPSARPSAVACSTRTTSPTRTAPAVLTDIMISLSGLLMVLVVALEVIGVSELAESTS